MDKELDIVVVPEQTSITVVQPQVINVVTGPDEARSAAVIDRDVHVLIRDEERSVVSVGHVGPPGPRGDEGAAQLLVRTAGVPLGGHRAVVLNASDEVVYADSADLTHRDKVLGVTTGAAAGGAAVSIQTFGELVEGSWSWILDTPVFLGLNGLLTQTPPASGFSAVIGFPNGAPTKLFINIAPAITL